MEGHHGPARCAVVDEHTGPGGLEAQDHLLARVDLCQVTAAERARRRVEIDVVHHRVPGGVDERELHVVVLVHDDDRARHATVEGHRLHEGAAGDLHLLLFHDEADLDDLWLSLGHLVVRR